MSSYTQVNELRRAAVQARTLHGRHGADHEQLRQLCTALVERCAAVADSLTAFTLSDNMLPQLVGLSFAGHRPTGDELLTTAELLDTVDVADPNFWHRIARLLDTVADGIDDDDIAESEDGRCLVNMAAFF